MSTWEKPHTSSKEEIKGYVETGVKPNETARNILESMSPQEKEKFIEFARVKYTDEQMREMYDVHRVPPTLKLIKDPEPLAEIPSKKIDVEDQELSSYQPFTSENTHMVTTELAYPAPTRTASGWDQELAGFIRSVCSMAEYYDKPFVQIAFSNGTGTFKYTHRDNHYAPKLIVDPGVVNDFE